MSVQIISPSYIATAQMALTQGECRIAPRNEIDMFSCIVSYMTLCATDYVYGNFLRLWDPKGYIDLNHSSVSILFCKRILAIILWVSSKTYCRASVMLPLSSWFGYISNQQLFELLWNLFCYYVQSSHFWRMAILWMCDFQKFLLSTALGNTRLRLS